MERICTARTIPEVLQRAVELWPEGTAQLSKNDFGQFRPRTFADLYGAAEGFAAGLASLGLQKGEPVGMVSDNRAEWLVADLAILGLGACDVPRGRDTLPDELVWILGKPECRIVCAENTEQAEKVLGIADRLPALRIVIVLDPEAVLPPVPVALGPGTPREVKLYSWRHILDLGVPVRTANPEFWKTSLDAVQAEDTATIIFTSGTTGEPKGVVLSHRNFCHQLGVVHRVIDIRPGDIFLSVLPVWHSFERIVQYITLATGSALAYSKPIGKIMLHDMSVVRPQWLASVPRIWEAIRAGVYKNATEHGGLKAAIFHFFVALGGLHADLGTMVEGLSPAFRPRNRFVDWLLAILPWTLLWPLKALGDLLVFGKVRAKLGGRFKAGISGGGSLPPDIDHFFSAAGICLLNGYGLTETAPVIALRNYFRPVPLTLAPLPDTKIRIVDDQDHDCPPGVRGQIKVRGDQVMAGYYRNPEATARILDTDGWLSTGDLGIWTHDGNFVIRGRAKDTIVLMGGENIEPLPIEAKLRESEYIDQVMVVGQDRKYLGALVQIDRKAVEQWLRDQNIPYIARSNLPDMPEVIELINEEITLRINSRSGFRAFERIGRFVIIDKTFETGVELSAKQEVKRHVIAELYRDQITALYR